MRAWVFGDDVDTDLIAPGRYMKFGIDKIAPHCFEAVRPEFAASVRRGDVVVGGRNFGAGSSREQAPAVLKHLGVSALIAQSFAGLFYRNALNLGLAALVCEEAKRVRDGDKVRVDPEAGKIYVGDTEEALDCEPIPAHLMQMVRDGGLLAHLEKRLGRSR
jgi:3-isopropylmalate/(R)-2-methylmalate dehydratase small subunit